MHDAAFVPSEPLTLGIEEEFLVVGTTSDGPAASPRADVLLGGSFTTVASPGGWFKPELLRCTVELATAASRDLAQLDVDLRALRDELVARADSAGLQLAATGIHPDLLVTRDLVTPTQAHRAIADLHERVGSLPEQSVHGLHVHVGMPSLGDALRVMDALAAHGPLFIACTANSPVAGGARTPWRSTRADVLRRMPWAGTPPRIGDEAEYRGIHRLHQLENAGDQRFQWEVAPVLHLGTLELRVCDVQPDPARSLAVAALVQAIAAHVLDGGRVERPNEALERHNRWSAMEFGMRARFLVAGRAAPVDVDKLLADALELARPWAARLGNEAWLEPLAQLRDRSPADDAIDAFAEGGVQALLRRTCIERGA